MNRLRLIPTAALVALALLIAPSLSDASSSTLLSGYGGPGEGNQAILGSTLIGGGGSSGRSGGSSGGSTSTAAGTSAAETRQPSSGSSTTGSSRTSAPKRRTHGGSPGGHASKSASPAYKPRSIPASAGSGGSGSLGLSGTDAVYIILALGGLALTAAATGRLARGAQ